jgi:hypothetical protein
MMKLLSKWSNNICLRQTQSFLRLETLDDRDVPSSILDLSIDDLSFGSFSIDDSYCQVQVSSLEGSASTTTNNASGFGTIVIDSMASSDDSPAFPGKLQQQAPPPTGPQIVGFTAVEIGCGFWKFSGTVTDPNPAGLTVTFGGQPVSLNGHTATTDANGNFSFSIQLNTDGSDNGIVTAQTTDSQGLQSNVAMCDVDAG